MLKTAPSMEKPWPPASPPSSHQPFSSLGLGVALRGSHRQQATDGGGLGAPGCGAGPPSGPDRTSRLLPQRRGLRTPQPPPAPQAGPPGCPGLPPPALPPSNTQAQLSWRAASVPRGPRLPGGAGEGPRAGAQRACSPLAFITSSSLERLWAALLP